MISQIVSALLCFWQLLRTKESYGLKIRKIRFDKGILVQIIKIGLPSGVQNSIIAFANVIVQSNINAFGEMAMAGYGAYTKVEGFGFLPINSFTMALTTFVGQNLGAKQEERHEKRGAIWNSRSSYIGRLIGVVVFLLAPQLIAAFDSSPEIIRFGVEKPETAALFTVCLHFHIPLQQFCAVRGRRWCPWIIMMMCWCVIRVSFLSVMIPLTHSIQAVYWYIR